MAWFDFLNSANARGRDAGSIARQRLSARAAIPSARPAIVTPAAGGLLNAFGRGATGFGALNYGAQQLKGVLEQAGVIPNIRALTSNIQNRPVVNPAFMRPDDSGAGERARRFQEYRLGTDIPGANTDYSARLNTSPSTAGSPAAERAYQQEVSRVAQLTAQDPELQRYENARKIAAGANATPEQVQSAEDIGMQIWAKANPKLAAKVKPGQAGFDAIQNTLGAGQMGSPLNLPFDASNPLGGTPAPANVSYAGTPPTPLTGMGALPMNAFGGITSTPFTSFGRGQTLQSAPLGMPSEMPNASYAGATGVTPVGTSITEDAFKGDKAKQLAAMYLNAQMGK